MREYLATATFTSGPGASTLPLVILSKARLGITPDISALSTSVFVMAAGVVGTVVTNRVQARRLAESEKALVGNG
ncbi:hypothetical protein [Microbaculum sp. FT89]|uniref:hypothetical protein n=1 Tax=Microbaculum sp. FT89 TaxID=3447298 RepID=UPI003F52C8E3